MRTLNWLMTSALLGALILGGCQPAAEATKDTSETGKKEVASSDSAGTTAAESVKKPEADSAGTVAKAEPATMSKEELAKVQVAKREAAARNLEKGGDKTLQKPTNINVKPIPGRPDKSDTVDHSKPVPKTKPSMVPKDANLGAVATNFTGTWKRYIDPKVRAKYKAVEAVQKKRGKKTFSIDSVFVVKPDGTFVLDENALIVGRRLTGTWSVVHGVAKFSIKAVDGKSPGKNILPTFEVMASKGGKMLYRDKRESGRYDKV